MDSTTPMNVTPVVVKTKAPKKPSLNVKYSRFLAFGHWFLSSQAELISEEVRGQLFQKLMMFDSVEEQTAFYEGFFGEVKETNKSIRKLVAASKKPVKAPKAPRAKKSKAVLPQDDLVAQLIADAAESGVAVEAADEATAAEAPKKEKKPRAKKVKATAAPVADAPPADAGADAPPADAGPVKEKKPRAKKAKAAETVAATVAATVVEPVTEELVTEPVVEPVTDALTVAPADAGPVKEKKPRAKKADGDKPKKTKKAEPVVEPAAAEESEDVQTRVVTIEGQEYLIDEGFNLYETKEPYAQVGKYDQASEKAIFE